MNGHAIRQQNWQLSICFPWLNTRLNIYKEYQWHHYMKINITNDSSSVLHLSLITNWLCCSKTETCLNASMECQPQNLVIHLNSCAIFHILYHILCYLDSEKLWSHNSQRCSNPTEHSPSLLQVTLFSSTSVRKAISRGAFKTQLFCDSV